MLLDVLQKYWGYSEFRPLQEEAMSGVLDARDSLVVLPTGGGKSLCYQAPAMCRDGVAVVVSPLISLMKDQVDSLKTCGISAAFINSTQSVAEKRQVADDFRSGSLRLLYIAPERLVQPHTIEFLQQQTISFIAVDEAHCISEWGHDFRPEFRELARLRESFPDISIHAFTATATEQVRQDIAEQLALRDPQILVGSFDRPNLVYRSERRDSILDQVREIIDRHKNESGIIYCPSRREVDSISEELNGAGYRTLPYHAGMPAYDRQQNQEAFAEESIDTIVATVAFGMGIDKSNVRYVIHTGMPKSLENYQQESGRAGRDSLEAECVLFYSLSEFMRWKKNIEDGSEAGASAAMHSLQAMVDYSTGVSCRHRSLVQYFGEEFKLDSCGACDVCLQELDDVEDALIVGQKILSSVVRQGERFGSEYTSLVLKGSRDKRVVGNGHDELSTWGILAQEAQSSIRDWIGQLVSQDFLVRVGEFGTLAVTPRGRELLRGNVTPKLLRAAETTTRQKKRTKKLTASWEGVDRELFDDLRILRHDLAAEAGVPAYVVFTDETLRELSRFRPSTLDTMIRIKGVGEKRLATYGEPFLDEILKYSESSGVKLDAWPEGDESARPSASSRPRADSSSVEPGSRSVKPRAFDMFREGTPLETVQAETDRAMSTVLGYLGEFIQLEGLTDPTPWIEEEAYGQVREASRETGTELLKPIYEVLEGEVSYDTIRIALACLRNEEALAD
jgi:ATP-dependent DNA helicase RecQ